MNVSDISDTLHRFAKNDKPLLAVDFGQNFRRPVGLELFPGLAGASGRESKEEKSV